MRLRALCAAVLVLGLLPGTGRAALDAGGTESPFSFGVGARALALGKAFTAVADDVTTAYWNPAGLGQLRQMELGACHVFLNEGTTYDGLACAWPWYGLGTFALSGLNIQTGGIELRDDHDYLGGTFGYQQTQGLLSFGRELFPGLHAGLNFKLERQTLLSYQSTGAGLDLGFLYNPRNTFSFGLVLQNVLPPEFKLVEPSTLPMSVRVGAAYRYAPDREGNHRFLVSAEAEKSAASLLLLHGGFEYRLYRVLALRAGWDRDRIMGGGGVALAGVELDYALAYREQTGPLHIASLNWRFGQPVEEAEKARRFKLVEEVYARLVQEQFAAHRSEGAACLNRDQFENAAWEYKKALGWKADARTATDLAQAQEQSRRQTARQYFEQGLAAAKTGRELDALATLREALKLDGANEALRVKIRELKGELLERAKRVKLPRRVKPQRQEFLAALDDYLEGRYPQALAGWQALAEKNPAYPEARAYCEQARDVVLRAQMLVSVNPEQDAKLKAALAEANKLYAAHQFKAALAAWQAALQQDPTLEAAKLGAERADLLVKALAARGLE